VIGSRERASDRRERRRAQAHVVGVSLMVGVTVLALAGLTVAIGTVVESTADDAEADRVADGLAIVADPGDVVGTAEAHLRFGDGRLRTDERTIRLVDPTNDSVVERIDSDVLVYSVGENRVIGGNGAVLQGRGGGASMVTRPSIVADRDAGSVLLLGVPEVDAPDTSISTDTSSRLTLRATVQHRRVDLGERRLQIAVQTAYPDAWSRYFEEAGATVVDRTARFDPDADGPPSVVAAFEGERQTYVIVHETDLEVI